MPNRRPPGWSSLLLVPGLIALLASPASARQADGDVDANADIVVAEQKAAQAFEAYGQKRFPEAVALYLEAYKAAPSADVLYNVARIYDAKLGDRPLAISFYRRYIADPGAVSDRIQIANERLAALREAELAVTRAPEPEPAAPAPGASPAARADGASFDAEGSWQPAEVTGVIMAVTGVVALGVGAGYGIAAMSETKTVRDICPNDVCSEQRGIDAAESASDHAAVSTIALASGGALLAVGAVLYFWLGDQPADTPRQAAGNHLQLALGQRPGGAALELGGTW